MSADDVARAIVAAARITRADPVMVVTGQLHETMAGRRANSHARSYAAIALLAAFPRVPKKSIGRMVGARAAGVFIAQLETDLRNDRLKWWNRDHLDAVANAIGTPVAAAPEAPADIAKFLPTRTTAPRWSDKVSRAAPPSKRALYDMLGEAVRNTGKPTE